MKKTHFSPGGFFLQNMRSINPKNMNRLVELDKLKQLSRKQERKEAVSKNSKLCNCAKQVNDYSVGAGGRSGHSGDHAKQQQGRNHGEVYQGVLQQKLQIRSEYNWTGSYFSKLKYKPYFLQMFRFVTTANLIFSVWKRNAAS